MRKAIQISNCAVALDDSLGPPVSYSLVALCDDGSIWELTSDEDNPEGAWIRLPEIPQDTLMDVH